MQGSKVLCFKDPDYDLRFLDSLYLHCASQLYAQGARFHQSMQGLFPLQVQLRRG